MARDERVVFLGEDVAAAGGVFKTTVGLLDEFGPKRVRDTPISEQAILGAAMGAAMTGLRPIAEIMFSDFLAVCWDIVANEIAKTRYMTNGQVSLPLVIRTANGGGLALRRAALAGGRELGDGDPGLKVVAPSTPADVKGLLAAAVRDPRPGALLRAQVAVRDEGRSARRRARRRRSARPRCCAPGKDCTIVALAAMVPRALDAAEHARQRARHLRATVIDVRSLVPLDTQTILAEVAKTGRLFTVEENPRLCGWGAEIASIVADECFWDLDGPIVRITTPHVPLPARRSLEDHAVPSVERIVGRSARLVDRLMHARG